MPPLLGGPPPDVVLWRTLPIIGRPPVSIAGTSAQPVVTANAATVAQQVPFAGVKLFWLGTAPVFRRAQPAGAMRLLWGVSFLPDYRRWLGAFLSLLISVSEAAVRGMLRLALKA